MTGYLSAYEKWIHSEGIPVIGGYFIGNLNRVALKNWKRKNGKGAFINLIGNQNSTDAYLCEIAPSGKLHPQRHLFEEIIYILSGRGATTIWNEDLARQSFEWQEGSLFAIPLNTWHQHFNGQGDKPCQYIAATNAPLVFNLFHNLDFIFNDKFVFNDRYSGQKDYFSNPGKLLTSISAEGLAPPLETNFVPDIRTVKLQNLDKRGGENFSLCFELADNTMTSHVSEFAVGTYKKAHRHGPGANIVIISGTGYSLMWQEGKPLVKVPWQSGSMFVPPDRWFHQHFNTGAEPVRYLALRWGSQKNIFPAIWKADEGSAVGKDQIAYEDENPEIRIRYEAELSKTGIKSRMDKLLEA